MTEIFFEHGIAYIAARINIELPTVYLSGIVS